jgi:hypothetical protein
MLSVIMLNVTYKPFRLSVIMLSVIKLSVIMMSVILMNVVMLNVVAPAKEITEAEHKNLEYFEKVIKRSAVVS